MIVAHEGRYTGDFGVYLHRELSLMGCLTPGLAVRPRNTQ